jgi:hypothetical protein
MAADRDKISEAKALLKLGLDTARSLKASNPEALDRLDQYTDAFEKWQMGLSPLSSCELSSAQRRVMERVAKQHATIIGLAEGMLVSVERSLKDLKGWSKGIRAYVDHLPKRVSTMKARKG